MSYTGLTSRQSTRFTKDIEMFIEFAIENTANDMNLVDSGKHLKSLATQFVEDYSKSIPKKSSTKKTSTKKVLTDEEKEEKVRLKAEKEAKKKAKIAETEEKKKLRKKDIALKKN